FFQAEDGIRDFHVTGVQTCALPIYDEGNQIGDALAETVTSITGDYTLTLPQGVNLAGNLIVRIQGPNQELRAQVVDKDVDISPRSEERRVGKESSTERAWEEKKQQR